MYEVKLLSYTSNGTTGYTTVNVCAVETMGNQTRTGPQKSYGIEADTLKALWSGDLNKWLAWVKQEHQKYHGLHESMETQLNTLVGKTL